MQHVCAKCGTDKSCRWRAAICNTCYMRQWRNNTGFKDKHHNRNIKAYIAKYPAARAAKSVRARLWQFMHGKRRFSATLGCTICEFKMHIEAQFQSGMTWDNYGQWEIDHKIPLIVAYAQGELAFKDACNYSNLQPLWKADNRSKGSSIGL